jgi:hypothetical protein
VSSLDWLMSISLVPLSFALTGPIAQGIGDDATMLWAGLLGSAVTTASCSFRESVRPKRAFSAPRFAMRTWTLRDLGFSSGGSGGGR